MAVRDPATHIRWRFGPISSREPPPIVLDNLPVCANCHSFSADGKQIGMDVDYANDKGSYVLSGVAEEIVLEPGKIITWSDYRREDKQLDLRLAVPDLAGRQVCGEHGQGPVGVCAQAGPGVLAAFFSRSRGSWRSTTARQRRFHRCRGPTIRSTCRATRLGARTASTSSLPGPRPTNCANWPTAAPCC